MASSDNSIHVLPQHVVEKIAAGEVIERPASVLKELVENAIDSSATSIDICVEDSGFGLLQVSDNGTGMSRNNLEKSILPHATSKIRNADDLFAVATMGFRGEALASICAISKATITSSNSNDGLGCSLTCDGGTAPLVTPAPRMRGTTVACRDLFYNVPARKKFMKTRRAERLALVKVLEQLVIPFPGIRFCATFDGKKALDIPAVENLHARISQVAGLEFAKTLVKAEGSATGMSVLVYFPLGAGNETRPRYQNLYVNLRRVDNDSVLFGIRQAFAQLLSRDARPSFFCFIDVDPAAIDVNVHPTKQKIKFENERELFGFIYGTVSRGLRPSLDQSRGVGDAKSAQMPHPTPGQFSEETARYTQASESFEQMSTHESNDQSYSQTILPFPSGEPSKEKPLDSPLEGKIQLQDESGSASWSLISCYQIHEMFILAPIKNGILLIDQHAAHERILYEQALGDLANKHSPSQQLLFPIVLNLNATEKAVVESSEEYFGAFGFEIQDFGGADVSVSATPAFMTNTNVEGAVREMIAYLLDEKSVEHFPEPHRRYAAAFACGAAIKAGQKLSDEEMNALLNSLFSSKNPYTCPHGRPTVVRISLDELSRRFLR
jgi:DNA mismatch repair protein MutL